MKIKIRKKEEEKNKTSLAEDELEEFQDSIQTVQQYEQRLGISLLDKKSTETILQQIQNRLIKKREITQEERLQRLENTVSMIANKKDVEKEQMKKKIDELTKKLNEGKK